MPEPEIRVVHSHMDTEPPGHRKRGSELPMWPEAIKENFVHKTKKALGLLLLQLKPQRTFSGGSPPREQTVEWTASSLWNYSRF